MDVGEDWRHKTLQDLEDVRLEMADKTICDNLIRRALPRVSKDVQLQFAHSKDSEKPARVSKDVQLPFAHSKYSEKPGKQYTYICFFI